MDNNKNTDNKLTAVGKVGYVLKETICGAGLTALATSGPTLMIYGGCGHINIYPQLALGIGIISGLGAFAGASAAIQDIKDYTREEKNEKEGKVR